MPELPEVETVKRGISKLVGKKITNVIIRHYGLRYKIDQHLAKQLNNQTIMAISRRAKYLIFTLEDGYLIIHLGMSGRLTLQKDITAIKTHDHVDIICDDFVLRYNDPRRFGAIIYTLELAQHFLFKNLGPEPLEHAFSAKYLLDKLQKRKSTIKQLLMDNHIVVGVGNIYACEALFLSQISPLRNGNSITSTEAQRLVACIKKVLTQAIELGGSSLKDYKQADGQLGYFQNVHNVYARAGKPCNKCQSPILEKRLGQRNSFYCPSCQI